MRRQTKILIAVLAVLAVIAGLVIVNYNRALDLRAYAEAHDCAWTWQGTWYGDDRDYICK